MSLSFAWSRIKSSSNSYRPIHEAIQNHKELLGGAGIWGAFEGIFGIASNEFFLVTTGDVSDMDVRLQSISGVASTTTTYLEPTVRPVDYTPVAKAGLYVFRMFRTDNAHVERIAELSATAWTWFENTEDYQAEPQGLFAESDRTEQFGDMLLCTWYDNLNSWLTSRQPAPEATANFRERGSLTVWTKAYATRLIQP